jgi:hypothetical protein
MLKHYSHIRMEAKKRAVAGLERLPKGISDGSVKEPAKVRPPN